MSKFGEIRDKAGKTMRRIPAGILVVLLIFVATLLWIIWGGLSQEGAFWAGAIQPYDTEVPVGTAAAGAWGDSFGGFNAFVGAIGASVVAATLYLQYRALEEQQKDQHLSRFEDNFFRLLDLVQNLRASLVYEQTPAFIATKSMYVNAGKQTGHAAIEAAYNEVNYWAFKAHSDKRKIRKKVIAAQYDNYVQRRYEFCFAPYFRIIYTILNKIRLDDRLDDGQKAYYGNLLRSQLTSFETGLIAFNATSVYSKDLLDLVEEFRLLKYLPLKRRKILGNIFGESAYAERT